MKKTRFFLVIMLSLFTVLWFFTLTACNDYNNGTYNNGTDNGQGRALSATLLDGLRLDFPDSSTHLGIVRNNPHQLVALDEYGVQTLVRFAPVNVDIDEELEQSEIDAEFEKLYVTQYFIYFTMTTRVIVRPTDCDDYDRTNFVSDDYTQSFLADRVNNHIYSLSVFPTIYRISGRTITVDRSTVSSISGTGMTVLLLTIENDRITYTDLIPNPQINATHVNHDGNGNLFIHTNMAEQFTAHPTIDNVYFLGRAVDYDSVFYLYAHDENNNFYRVHFFRSVEQVQVFYNGAWIAPAVDGKPLFLCFRNNIRPNLNDDYFWSGNVKLMDGYIVSTIGGFTFAAPTTTTNNAIYIGDSHFVRGLTWNFMNSSYGYPLFFGENHRFLIRANPQGQVFYVDLQGISTWDTADLEISGGWSVGTLLHGVRFEMATIENFVGVRGEYVVAVHEGLFGTRVYKIYIDNDGAVRHMLYNEEAFNPNIIVLRPLVL